MRFLSVFFAVFFWMLPLHAQLQFESGDSFHVEGDEVFVRVMCSTEGRLISKGAVGCGYYDIDPVAQDRVTGFTHDQAFLAHLKWENGEADLTYDGPSGRSEETINLIDILTEPELAIEYAIMGRDHHGDVQPLDRGTMSIKTTFDVQDLGWTWFHYSAPWEPDCWRFQPSAMDICLSLAPQINARGNEVRTLPLPEK